MSESGDTDANGSVIFVAEQHTVRVDVHPVPNPPKPCQYSPRDTRHFGFKLSFKQP